MQSSLNIRCSACDSMYTLSSEELNVLVLFKCYSCGEYNTYISGHVLALDKNIMNNGTEHERRQHVIEILQFWACEFAGNVLSNVDKVIDVNVGAGLRISDSCDFAPPDGEDEDASKPSLYQLHPTILWEDAPGITRDEVRDFINIDLNLIDSEQYFNKFFGRLNR